MSDDRIKNALAVLDGITGRAATPEEADVLAILEGGTVSSRTVQEWIATADGLDALPIATTVCDRDGAWFQRRADGWLYIESASSKYRDSAWMIERFGPFTLSPDS